MVEPLLMSATASSAEAYSFEPPLFTAGALADLRAAVVAIARQLRAPTALARGKRAGCAQMEGVAARAARTTSRGRNWRVIEGIVMM